MPLSVIESLNALSIMHIPVSHTNGRSMKKYKLYGDESPSEYGPEMARLYVTPHHQMRHKSHTKVLSKWLNKEK